MWNKLTAPFAAIKKKFEEMADWVKKHKWWVISGAAGLSGLGLLLWFFV